jgi:hypothetical protein
VYNYRRSARRWIIKDLAGLFPQVWILIEQEDILRFMKFYGGKHCEPVSGRRPLGIAKDAMKL